MNGERYRDSLEACLALDPWGLKRAWHDFARMRPAGDLFRFCTPTGRAHPPDAGPGGRPVGDPLMVAGGKYWAWTEQLTGDVRRLGLPCAAEGLTPAELRTLARLQEDMDLTIRSPAWLAENRWSLDFVAGEWAGDDGARGEDDGEGGYTRLRVA